MISNSQGVVPSVVEPVKMKPSKWIRVVLVDFRVVWIRVWKQCMLYKKQILVREEIFVVCVFVFQANVSHLRFVSTSRTYHKALHALQLTLFHPSSSSDGNWQACRSLLAQSDCWRKILQSRKGYPTEYISHCGNIIAFPESIIWWCFNCPYR